MKKILLVNSSFNIGGIETAMINTANELSKYYDVTVFCYAAEGDLMQNLSPEIHLLQSSWRISCLQLSLKQSLKKGIKYFVFKIFSVIWSRLFDNRLPISIAIRHQKHLGFYDLACAFRHEHSKHNTYSGFVQLLCKKVESPIKLSWIHFDAGFCKEYYFPKKYINKISGIVGVSKAVSKAFSVKFPEFNIPVYTCYNILNCDEISEKSKIPQEIPFKENSKVCFTASRLNPEKGFERAIRAFSNAFLTDENLFWFIAGDGPCRLQIENIINSYGLSDRIILLGALSNPYNYMKNADLYINASYQEAAPMVFMEAKYLGTPIFATRTLSVDEMLDNGVDVIAENDEQSLKKTFESVVLSGKLDEMKKKASDRTFNNGEAISFYKKWLIEN